MDDKRAQTLEALEQFVQSQKAALERVQGDIDRLKQLRSDVQQQLSLDFTSLQAKLNAPAFKLSEQLEAMPPLPKDLDWSVFKGANPAPFAAMAAGVRAAHAARQTPPKTPLAPCALREFVASRRAALLDPVLRNFRLPEELALLSSDDEAPDPEEVRRARERDKIRELKKRRIVGDGVPARAGLGLRKPAVAGVHIRRDVADEAAEVVDISMGEEEGARSGAASGSGEEVVPMVVDTPPTSIASPASVVPSLPQERSVRERRPSRKAQQDIEEVAKRTKPSGKLKVKLKVEPPPEPEPEPEETTEPPRDKKGKAKSETYKQAWSVSEQHLLERLLDEIPDGEKNRWAKISKAMNGRRTARQVASRVQKYYEKLKRFGIEVGGSKSGAAGGSTG